MIERNSITASVLIVAWLLSLMLIRTTEARAVNQEIISYSLTERVTLHEPVVVNFSVNNVLQETLKVNLGKNKKGAFRIVVTKPNGERIQPSQLVKIREGISSPGLVTLEPGQSYKQGLIINEWYDFPGVGEYVIEVELSDQSVTQPGSAVYAFKKFRATVQIIAKDSERLKKISESLAQQVLSSETSQDAFEAAVLLSHVKDPVAIPYLKLVLESNKMVEEYAISGLARIGNTQAAIILISLIDENKEEVSILARNALWGLEAHSTDLSLKKRIRRAMKRVP